MATNGTHRGQAEETKDYRGIYETVTIPQGQTSTVVDVTIIDDDEVEGNEQFHMFLFNADGVEFDDHPPESNNSMLVNVTIIDDD